MSSARRLLAVPVVLALAVVVWYAGRDGRSVPPPPAAASAADAPDSTLDEQLAAARARRWRPGRANCAEVVDAPVDRPPRRLTAPPLGYPEDARRAGLEGHVVFEMAIGTNGIPVPESFVVIEADDSLFVAAAREAALGSRYEPAMAGGHPVCVMVRQPIDFVLPRQR